MQTKRLAIQLKAEKPGALKAVFATFDVVDNDGDVTRPGAFTIGSKVPIAGVGHNWDIPTIGGGTVRADSEKAWIDGQFNLEMTSAQEHWKSIKFDQEQEINRQEYSYAYDVLKGHSARPDELKVWPGAKRVLEELVVHEISPVLLGAGVGTGTLLVKGRKRVEFSDEQRRREIQQAVEAAKDGDEWFGPYVVATYADHVIVAEPDGVFRSVTYTIDPKGQVELGDEIEVLQTWSPKARLYAARLKVGRVLSSANRDRLSKWVQATKETMAEVEALLADTDPDKDNDAKSDTAILRSAFRADRARLARTFGIHIAQ